MGIKKNKSIMSQAQISDFHELGPCILHDISRGPGV